MSRTNFDMLLQAGCHFGHLKRKWNPAMSQYIYTERNGIHIIDLHKTVVKLDEAADALKQIAKSGKKILFVATKKQTKEIIAEKASSVNMPYVIERWPGGMLTNFPTIRKAVKKMANIDKLMQDGTFANLSKRELLQITRQRAKLEKNLGSIADLTRLPSALFVVDVLKEQIAVREANRLGIPVFGIVDTNSDPKLRRLTRRLPMLRLMPMQRKQSQSVRLASPARLLKLLPRKLLRQRKKLLLQKRLLNNIEISK